MDADGGMAERRGGWGALAVAACGGLRLAGLVMLAGDRASPLALLLVVVAGLGGAAGQALAVEGARRRLGAPSRLIWTATAAGWIGAALAAGAALLVAARLLAAPGADALRSGLLLGWSAAFATALWAAGVSAADWRRGRLPPWLRVTGTTFAVLSLAAAVLPPLGALAAPAALAWWIGLGVVLLRAAPRSTSG